MTNEELKIRLRTERRIYEDSPNLVATYKDLARWTELFEEVLENNKQIGFKAEAK
jgi:hypothetical protein